MTNVGEAGIGASSCVSHTWTSKVLVIVIDTHTRGGGPPPAGGHISARREYSLFVNRNDSFNNGPKTLSPRPRVLVIHSEARCWRPQQKSETVSCFSLDFVHRPFPEAVGEYKPYTLLQSLSRHMF